MIKRNPHFTMSQPTERVACRVWWLFTKDSEGKWTCDPDSASLQIQSTDRLKILLREASALVQENSHGLALILSAQATELSDIASGLAPLSRFGLSGILLDAAAAAALPSPFRASRIGVMPGIHLIGHPFQAYRLDLTDLPGIQEESPARSALWQQILAALEDGGQVVSWKRISLAGQTGAGKSHLLQTLATHLQMATHKVAKAACLPSDTEGWFTPWMQILGHFEKSELESKVRSIGKEMDLDDRLIDNLGRFLTTPNPQTAAALTPVQNRELLPTLIARFIVCEAESSSLVCMVDDIQWMDDASAQVLRHLEHARPPIYLLLGRRGLPESGDLAVLPLSLAENRRFLMEITRQTQIAEDLNTEIHQITGGIPLVIKEVIHVLTQQGSLCKIGATFDLKPDVNLRQWHGAENGLIGIGDRLRLLPGEWRKLFGACAIWREPFTIEQARAITDACFPEVNFDEIWQTSIRSDFLIQSSTFANKFLFYHDLLRESARQLLPPGQSRTGHRAALAWLENHGLAALSPEAAAYHAREGGLLENAIDYYDLAANAALSRFALKEARLTTQAAWELDTGDAAAESRVVRRAKRYLIAGEAEFHSGMMQQAEPLLEKSLKLYSGVSRSPILWAIGSGTLRQIKLLFFSSTGRLGSSYLDNASAARAALMLGEIAYFQNRQSVSSLRCLLALDLASKNGDSAFLASLCAAIACPLAGRRPSLFAARYLEIAERMISRVGDAVEATYISHVSSLAHLGAADWETASLKAARSADFWRTQGHGRREEEACLFAFYADYFRGNLQAASRWAERLEKTSAKRSDAQSQFWALTLHSLIGISCGGATEARESCLAAQKNGGDVLTHHGIEVLLARCAWLAGSPWQALEHLQAARRLDAGESPVSATQFLMGEAAVLLGEMIAFGPAELREDRDFQELTGQMMRSAKGFSGAFPLGHPSFICGNALVASRAGSNKCRRLFALAHQRATRLGMRLVSARILCFSAIFHGSETSWKDGLAALTACGAKSEVEHFQQLRLLHG
jgi:tetratricopeptide (TPR) repeat protein